MITGCDSVPEMMIIERGDYLSKARILSLQEAEEWCKFNSPTRNKPIVQEYVQTWDPNRNVILEWIYPNELTFSSSVPLNRTKTALEHPYTISDEKIVGVIF